MSVHEASLNNLPDHRRFSCRQEMGREDRASVSHADAHAGGAFRWRRPATRQDVDTLVSAQPLDSEED